MVVGGGGGGGGVVGAPAPPRSLILQKCVLWGKKDPEATLLSIFIFLIDLYFGRRI